MTVAITAEAERETEQERRRAVEAELALQALQAKLASLGISFD